MIGLVSCSVQKLARPAPARELYCSPLFRKSLAYAESRCEHVYVLSAMHHLLDLDKVIEPYDRRLGTTKREREIWAIITAGALESKHKRADLQLMVLAGADYAGALIGVVCWWWKDGWRSHVHQPLQGMQVGERLRWLNDQLAGSAAQ